MHAVVLNWNFNAQMQIPIACINSQWFGGKQSNTLKIVICTMQLHKKKVDTDTALTGRK